MSRTAVSVVKKFFPDVTRVVDARTSMEIEVTKDDCKKGKSEDPSDCALARAAQRQADGAVISTSVAYIVSGDKAYRYRVPTRTSREIVCFDRAHDFRPGTYKFRAPVTTEKLMAKRESRIGPSKKVGRKPVVRKNLKTEGIRHIG